MNEIEIIRAQLALEAQHARTVARLCAETLGSDADGQLRQAGDAYLATVLGWFAVREQRFAALLETPNGAEVHDEVRTALARVGTSAAALVALQAARIRSHGWRELTQFLDGDWRARQEALDAALAPSRRTADWRTAAALRADEVLRERSLYARVTALRPAMMRSGGV